MTPTVRVVGNEGIMRDLVARIVRSAPKGQGDDAPTVLVLIDPTDDDWATARELGARIVLMSHDVLDDHAVAEAILAGADAVLRPTASAREVREAVERVAGGQTVLDGIQTHALADAARARRTDDPAPVLTPREIELLACVERGMSNKQIARHLGIQSKTVENLQSRMFRKLGVRSRTQALVRATDLGCYPASQAS